MGDGSRFRNQQESRRRRREDVTQPPGIGRLGEQHLYPEEEGENRPPVGGNAPGHRRPSYASMERARQQEMDRYFAGEARAQYNQREEFIAAAETAAARHPEINQQVFKDIIAAYDAEQAEYSAKLEESKRTAPNEGFARVDRQHAKRELLDNVYKRIEHHGPIGKAAMAAIAEEKQPESMFTPLVRMFYNSDKGGLQLGGLGGAAAFGGIAYYLASSMGGGGILTWLATAGATLLGAYAGNQVFPGKDTLQRPNFRTPAPVRGPAKSPEIKPDAPSQDIQANLGPMPEGLLANKDIKPAELTGRELIGFTPDTTIPAPQPGKSQQV